MDGDLGALPELCALAEEFGCIMMVDDAHASGVFGKNGRGTVDHFGMHGRVDIQVGTLSKAIGALGGYVAGSAGAHRLPVPPRAAVPLLHVASAGGGGHLHRRARRLLEQEPADHRPAVGEHAVLQGRASQALGFNTGHRAKARSRRSSSARARCAMKLSDRLFEEGVFAQGIAFPTVARDKARVRTIVTATHTREELQFALDVFKMVGSGTRPDLSASDHLMRRRRRARSFLNDYTRDLTPADFQRLFTRDAAEAYRFFTRHVDAKTLDAEPWYRRWPPADPG